MSHVIDTYIAGGLEYMHPLSLIFLFNVATIIYLIIRIVNKKEFNKNWVEAIKHLAGFAVAFGAFGTLSGFFFAFDALEKSKEIIPFQVIMGGLKVALINILYGLIVFFVSMLAYIVLKLRISMV